MKQTEILDELKGYISREVLDGKDVGLDESTPLLEWGIIDSMGMANMVSFIQNRFHVEIPDDMILPEHFINLSALSNLVVSLTMGGNDISGS